MYIYIHIYIYIYIYIYTYINILYTSKQIGPLGYTPFKDPSPGRRQDCLSHAEAVETEHGLYDDSKVLILVPGWLVVWNFFSHIIWE